LQGDAGATFVHKEIERVIDTASAVLFTFSIPERLLALIGKSDPSVKGLRFGALQISNSPSVRNQGVSALLDQARAILTNRHDIAQHFFTRRLTIEIVEESGCMLLVVLWKFRAIRAFVEMDESLEPQNDAFLFTVKIL